MSAPCTTFEHDDMLLSLEERCSSALTQLKVLDSKVKSARSREDQVNYMAQMENLVEELYESLEYVSVEFRLPLTETEERAATEAFWGDDGGTC